MDKPSFYWGIASYDRVDRQPMLLSLVEMGYQPHQIILSVQTPTDYEKYREKYGELATIIFREGSNVSQNKNNILDYLETECGNTRVVMCSDKVRAINRMSRDKVLHPINSREEMDAFIKKAFFISKRVGAAAFGCYSVGNTFYMSNTMSTNMQMLGCFMGILDPSLQKFDPDQPLKEDFEFILRHISAGRSTLRFNDVCLTATLHTKGGCHSAWNSDGDRVNQNCNDRILAMYPDLVKPHATRKNEQRYIGPKSTIKQSIFDL